MQVEVRQDMPVESIIAVLGAGDATRVWLNGKYGDVCWRLALARTPLDADEVLSYAVA